MTKDQTEQEIRRLTRAFVSGTLPGIEFRARLEKLDPDGSVREAIKNEHIRAQAEKPPVVKNYNGHLPHCKMCEGIGTADKPLFVVLRVAPDKQMFNENCHRGCIGAMMLLYTRSFFQLKLERGA